MFKLTCYEMNLQNNVTWVGPYFDEYYFDVPSYIHSSYRLI